MAKGGPGTGFFSRNRGFAELTKRFHEQDLAAFVDRLARDPSPSLLEIGCGEGRVLQDLWLSVPHLRLHGLNKAPWQAMEGGESLRTRIVAEGLRTADEAAALEPPDIRFGDASELPWADASMDVVVSQVAIHYVARKDRVLEETWRVLKPGGRAYLHVDTWKHGAPDFLRGETPRFLVYDGDDPLPLRKALKRAAKAGFDISVATDASRKKVETFVLMRKDRREPLQLGWTFDDASSFDLHRLHTNDLKYETYWGYRSVFTV